MANVYSRAWFAISLVVSSPVAPAAAQVDAPSSESAGEPSNESANEEREARALFEAGRAALDDGEYDRAYEYFARAHALSGHLELVFNMALAADRARRDDDALVAYRRFLREQPAHPRRQFIEGRIAAIEAGAGDGSGAAIALGIAGGVLVAAGAVFVVLSIVDDAAVADAPVGADWQEFEGAYDRVMPFRIGGAIGVGLGLAGIATAITLALVNGRSGSELVVRF